jgi:hypothetical protein
MTTLAEALRELIGVCEGLAEQQAMRDDWYVVPLMDAREALAAHDAQQQKTRQDFIDGYDAGMIDGRACGKRDHEAQQQYPYAQPPNTRPLSEVIAEWEADPEKKSALDRARAQQQEPLTDEQHQFILDNWCGYARLKNGVYELFGMRSCKAMEDGDWHPISVPFDPQTAQQQEPVQQLERWGKAEKGSGYLLQPREDGYWTPWHVAQDSLDAAVSKKAQQQEVNSKSRLKRLAVQRPVPCIGNDPLCPCQDGLACHYKDAGKTKAFPIQE